MDQAVKYNDGGVSMQDDIKKNTRDIHDLTVVVTRLATIVENSEKRHDSDMVMMREALGSISRLNERIGATLSIEKDIVSIRETLGDRTGDVRTLRHDLNTAMNALQLLPGMNEKIAIATGKIEAMEKWRDNFDGAKSATKTGVHALWAFVSVGGLGLIAWLVNMFNGMGKL